MLTLETIQDKVNSAKLYYLQLLSEELTMMRAGCGSTKSSRPLKRVITALGFQLDAQVIDKSTIALYNCLIKLLSGYSGTYQLDPDVVIPGQTTVVITQVVGYNINKYPFATTDLSPVAIFDNYHELYYPLYGNDPVLSMYISSPVYTGDEQTPPIIDFAVPGDTNSDIVSIRYEYPLGTTGELQMSGKAPGSGGSGSNNNSGNSGTTVLTFTQANLLDAGGGNWYLPLTIPAGKKPVFVEINGVSTAVTFDSTFTPPRLLGFANNDTQTIKVTII